MLFTRKLIDFSKPKFLNLDYTDIVVEDKTLFFISWKLKRHHKLKIYPLNQTYCNPESAVVLKMPAATEEIIITVHSLWRRRKYRVMLKKVRLDKETARHLIMGFKPVNMLNLKTLTVNCARPLRNTNLPVIDLYRHRIKIKTQILSISTDKLTYTNKTNHYE